ncbi:fucose mutarotase-like isoform X2 [Gigantopelta aegis]|uniref:fucose mutarotase-like isoform X2 n=1 Tax=Gigantopelta aegis TaxID=1735272 RepID=UPI001B88DC03|nr:fucose mutarotase-like isoform X2 [Gigantopelta aegis]
MPLKHIPKVLSPDLLHVLSSMGHGDEIVLADAHFPTSSVCRSGPKEVRADGLDIPTLLKGIMKLLPLDAYVPAPVAVMELVDSDKAKNMPTPIWHTYQQIVDAAEGKNIHIEKVERFKFYDRAKQAFAVVHTGETAQYGNIILKKGIIVPSD